MRDCVRIALFVMALVTFAFHGTVLGTIYSWQDAEGNTHFTDDLTRVPPSQREGAMVEHLPEHTINVTPAPPPPPPPSDTPTDDTSEPKSEYEECQEKVTEEKEQLISQLEKDEDRLVELNRVIHRSTTSRKKNAYQRERVEVKERIAKAHEALRETIPPMEHECETIRYWQGED